MSTTAKFDKSVIEGLISQIESASKKKTAKAQIRLSLKENNLIKAINPEFSFDLLGDWNGYGYTKLGKHLQAKNYKESLKQLKKLLKKAENKKVKPKKEKTEEEKINAWAERLARLTGITVDEATEIAYEKINFKIDKLFEAMNYEGSGWKIPAWQKKAERDYDRITADRYTALDKIKDEGHARAILIASQRHNESNYEDKLAEAKDLVAVGELDKIDAKDWARQNMQYSQSSVYFDKKQSKSHKITVKTGSNGQKRQSLTVF